MNPDGIIADHGGSTVQARFGRQIGTSDHTPTKVEVIALTEAESMLRFASEHVNNLDSSLSLALAEVVEAKHTENWTPAVSQQFWKTFSTLCDVIKPVTVDCLRATHEEIPPRAWQVWLRWPQSLAQ